MIQCSVWKEEDDYCKVDKRKCGKTNWYETVSYTHLEKRGFQNIELMKNCKELQKLSFEELPHSFTEPYALCTFSRVMKGLSLIHISRK